MHQKSDGFVPASSLLNFKVASSSMSCCGLAGLASRPVYLCLISAPFPCFPLPHRECLEGDLVYVSGDLPMRTVLMRQYLHCDSGTLLGLKLNSGSHRIFIPLISFSYMFLCFFFCIFTLPPEIRYHILLFFL